MPTPATGSTIKYTDVTTEFTLTVNPPSRAIGADFRFAGGTYTPASPAIPTGSTATISLSGDLGGRTKVSSGPLYSFDNFLFTSSNVTGPTGPTLANFQAPPTTPGGLGQPFNQILNIFSNVAAQPWFASYWSLYLSRPGYQQWTVPETSVYSVIACGAPGGWHQAGTIANGATNNATNGGWGAVVAGAFSFTRGQNLIITVGQQGVSTFGNIVPASTWFQGKGGGGATTIVDAANTSIPILVAAGGGGQSSPGTGDFSGGRGNRAFALITATGSTSAAGTDAQPGSKAFAAGFGADGAGSGTTAKSWANGSTGGTNNDTLPGAGFICAGGFGGGGPGGWVSGSQSKGGGGGGWIGGNGSSGIYGGSGTAVTSGGGGGISYCLATTSPNVGSSPLYTSGCYQTATTGGSQQPMVRDGYCWIKKITPRSTLLPLITFTDCYAYRYPSGGSAPPLLSDRAIYYTDPNLTDTLSPYWFGVSFGYHAWCVPRTGVYEISAAGGGGDYSYTGNVTGGRGRIITARYNLNIGDVLIVQVGQRGYSTSVPAGNGGGGGCTTVHLGGMTAAWNGTSGNPMSTTFPGYPLICASGGNGGAAVAAGADASATDLTGAQSEGGGLIATTNNTISSGGNLYAETTGRTGAWCQTSLPNNGNIQTCMNVAAGFGAGGFAGYGGGGRGAATVNLTGGGAGWVAGGGSTNGTGGGAQSYYWSGTNYVAGSKTAGYNAYAPQNPAAGTNVGSGYVTIQGIS